VALYEIAIVGLPTNDQKTALSACISHMIEPFGLHFGEELSLTVADANFRSSQRTPAAIVFFGAAGIAEGGLPALRRTALKVHHLRETAHHFGQIGEGVSKHVPRRHV
jgi:hypothetical protein